MRGTNTKHIVRRYAPIVRAAASYENWALGLATADFPQKTEEFREILRNGKLSEDDLARVSALCREAARRILGERLYDVQLVAALALYDGMVIEMKTGEGKTISSMVTIYLHAIAGAGVHLVTVNDYLAQRDAAWMGAIYECLGLTVGYIVNAMPTQERAAAYRADITYGTNNEFGFDYLRDNMVASEDMKVQRGHPCCIIDEVDSILIDEARTPLIISGTADDDTRVYKSINGMVHALRECKRDADGEYPDTAEGDYKIDEKSRTVSLTNQGIEHIEQLLLRQKIINQALTSGSNFEYIHYVSQALRAHYLYGRDKDYVVKEGQVQIVDEFTGRVLAGRRYSEGLHQAIEAKEGVAIARRSRTLAAITLQNYFRMYGKIAGMTGTALTEERELIKIYGLQVAVIPTNYPIVRQDEQDLIYADETAKYQAICDEVKQAHAHQQPVLVGTATIESSEKLSELLKQNGLAHSVLNAKNHAHEAEIVREAGQAGSITIATNMAGRGTDIKIGESRQAGGLYVLGSERHESRRIDNQLRGRSGRQGDPGISRFFISMDDQLMRLFGGRGDMLKSLISRSTDDGSALNHPLISKSIERAQKRIEDRNFEIRKHLLEFDDVLNEQRSQIYTQRDEILVDETLHDRAMRTVESIVTEHSQSFVGSNDRADAEHALTTLSETLYYPLGWLHQVTEGKTGSKFHDALMDAITINITDKRDLLGAEVWNSLLRSIYLRTIDMHWQDHLESLDALREAVYLRSYAQKNPLLEYKLEGFQLFDQLFVHVRKQIAARVAALKIEQNDAQARTQGGGALPLAVPPAAPHGLITRHSSFGQFGALQQGGAPQPAPAAAPRPAARRAGGGAPSGVPPHPSSFTGRRPPRGGVEQITRAVEKVGRNEPCPCGSGKKYKYCHGR